MFELAEIIRQRLVTGISDTYWIKNPIDSDLKDISVVFNLSNTGNRGTFDQPTIIQTFVLDLYLNVPENKFQELKTKSIYIQNRIASLTANEHIKYVSHTGLELTKLEDTNVFSNRISYELQYVQ
jgi:hypothetical protein